MRTLAASLIATLLLGCASPIIRSSGVAKVGPDTYTVSTLTNSAGGGELGARRAALDEANLYCANQRREVMITSIDTRRPARDGFRPANDGHASLIFRCLVAGDPDLKRPDFLPVPSTVIEDRRGPTR